MVANSDNDPQSFLHPGSIIRPSVKVSDIDQMVSKHFGLQVIYVKELDSYYDQNFHIQVSSKVDNPHIENLCSHGYTLKILNSMESRDKKLVEAQNEMMLSLHSQGFNVPKPEKSVHGSHMIFETFIANNGTEELRDEHIVRLLAFLPGKVLNQVEHTPELLYEVGVLVGKIDMEVKDFENVAIKSRKLFWMLNNTSELSKIIFAVKNKDHHRMIMEILETWKSKVEHLIPELEKGTIHGDCSAHNIIVKPETNNNSKFYVHGLIDFGHVQFSCYVFEIAIAIMYCMLEVNVNIMNPNDTGGHILAGYLTQRKISNVDWEILRECVAARFAQSLVIGAYGIEQEPGNVYRLATAAKGWKVLSDFWSTPKDQIISRWKAIISSYEKRVLG